MTDSAPSAAPKLRGERLSIYAGAPMQLALGGYDENRSGRINTICARYLDIVAEEGPTWTEAQWSAVCDALNGCWLTDDASIRYMWAEIADADRLNGLGKKWSIDALALSAEIRDMSLAGKVAVAEIVERFWQRAELPPVDALHQAGAKVGIDAVLRPADED